MLESEIQKQILTWLKANRFRHWRLSLGSVKVKGARKRNPMRGFPDIFGLFSDGLGRMFVIEVKTKTGRLSEEQTQCRLDLESAGAVYILARSLDDVSSVLRAYEEAAS